MARDKFAPPNPPSPYIKLTSSQMVLIFPYQNHRPFAAVITQDNRSRVSWACLYPHGNLLEVSSSILKMINLFFQSAFTCA
jgi:hypothetical protein